MTTFALVNAVTMVGAINVTPYLNKVALKLSVAELDATTFNQSHQVKLGGLKTIEYQQDGLWDSFPDASIFLTLGAGSQAVMVQPSGIEGGLAYIFQGANFKYDQFGAVGEIVPFSMSMSGTDGIGIIRGQNAAFTRTVSATGQVGSVLTITGPSATQYIYATLHVHTAATTITVLIESAPASNFATPTTRATIGPLTTTGGTFMTRVVGPVTDGFWRMNVSAITGTFVISGAIGIQ